MSTKENITLPPGRLVAGSIYEPQTTGPNGEPLLYKQEGEKKGTARVKYFFAVAIPKKEQHWSTSEWGAKIWATGHENFPGGRASQPDFAWKITDGDDANTVNSQNKPRKVRPCDRIGYPGHWILSLEGAFAPTAYKLENGKPVTLLETGAIYPGAWVQATCAVVGNKSVSNPGVHLNHSLVCLIWHGEKINFGIDVNSVGFGTGFAGALPPGASITPVASTMPIAVQPTHAPQAASIYSQPIQPTYMPPVATPQLAAPPTNIVPHPTILDPALLAPPAVIAPLIKIVKPHPIYNKEGTGTYDQMIALGWTDVTLAQQGML